MEIGVIGGTFDPIHRGHLSIAEEARVRLNLAQVLFVPAGQPQLRTDTPVSPVEQRVQMVRLAITNEPCFKLSTVEIERSGPSYTVDTIAQLNKQVGAGDELFFIMGWDSLSQLPQWKEPSELIKLCQLVVVPRPGFPNPDLDSLSTAVPGLSRLVILLDRPRLDISASRIRDRVSRGLPVNHLVPDTVERYIRDQGLYLDRD